MSKIKLRIGRFGATNDESTPDTEEVPFFKRTSTFVGALILLPIAIFGNLWLVGTDPAYQPSKQDRR